MIAGSKRFDTRLMQAVPRLFIKMGVEGVFCGSIPHAGLGFALKCDDGTVRGAQVAIAQALACLPFWTVEERATLCEFVTEPVTNANKIIVGEIRAANEAHKLVW